MVLVYLAVNIAAIRAFRTEFRSEFRLGRHLLVPAAAAVLLLFPLWGILHPAPTGWPTCCRMPRSAGSASGPWWPAFSGPGGPPASTAWAGCFCQAPRRIAPNRQQSACGQTGVAAAVCLPFTGIMTDGPVFTSRLTSRQLLDSDGMSIGRVRDVVILPTAGGDPPWVLGLVVTLQRRQIFVNLGRVAEISIDGAHLQAAARST